MKKFLGFFVLIALISCVGHQVDAVDSFYENGQAKIVKTYMVKGNDSITLSEVQYHKGGEILLKGNYKEGLRDGEWLSWYADGTIWSKGYFLKGKRDGKSWIYHPNGALRMKGSYKNGQKIGKWIIFNEEGVIIAEEEF